MQTGLGRMLALALRRQPVVGEFRRNRSDFPKVILPVLSDRQRRCAFIVGIKRERGHP